MSTTLEQIPSVDSGNLDPEPLFRQARELAAMGYSIGAAAHARRGVELEAHRRLYGDDPHREHLCRVTFSRLRELGQPVRRLREIHSRLSGILHGAIADSIENVLHDLEGERT